MYEKIRAYVREHGMLEEQDTVIAGISGGADSVCLLCVLLMLKREYGLRLFAVHVNHGLRGEEADADEAFVEELCRRENVPLDVVRVDVARLAREEGLSGEEAGRLARRRAFEEAASRHGAGKIALAHHRNDNAETVLLHLARGTGLRGLGGIRPVTGRYIRPLLAVSREEIEQFLAEKNRTYCMDSTNSEDTYTRNRIRNHIIPYMEEAVNTKVVDHVCETARQMSLLWDYMDRQRAQAAKEAVRFLPGKSGRALEIGGDAYRRTDPAVRPYLLSWALEQTCGRAKDLETVHLEQVDALFGRQVGRELDLPCGMTARRTYAGVQLQDADFEEPDGPGADRVRMRVLEASGIRGPLEASIPKTPYTKWFDYDIIKDSVIIRTYRPGDYITVSRSGGTKKLNRYFIDEKIPAGRRGQILLAADGNHILWVIGYRQGCGYEVTAQTERILEITVEEPGM